MELESWPENFVLKKAGIGCPQCDHGRVAETEHGVRFFVGEVADGVFRGRHVGAPHEMTAREHAAFWSEIAIVASAIERVYEPIHLNFQILGNLDPHVHVHIVPRRDPDPAPSMPLPAEAWSKSRRSIPRSLLDNSMTSEPPSPHRETGATPRHRSLRRPEQ